MSNTNFNKVLTNFHINKFNFFLKNNKNYQILNKFKNSFYKYLIKKFLNCNKPKSFFFQIND